MQFGSNGDGAFYNEWKEHSKEPEFVNTVWEKREARAVHGVVIAKDGYMTS